MHFSSAPPSVANNKERKKVINAIRISEAPPSEAYNVTRPDSQIRSLLVRADNRARRIDREAVTQMHLDVVALAVEYKSTDVTLKYLNINEPLRGDVSSNHTYLG